MKSKSLIILSEAEEDITLGFDWYSEQQQGLGEEFLECVDACFDQISDNPKLYPVVHESYRRALVHRFPYAVFYEETEEVVVVFAVFHGSQNPDQWRSRLS